MRQIKIFDNDKELLSCHIEAGNFNKYDLDELVKFLVYYKQNYKVEKGDTAEHICANMNCVRSHIIDFNVSAAGQWEKPLQIAYK